jgi:hypothetical protein
MNQMSINQQLSAIWQLLVNNFEYGASVEEISAALPFELERRTLQRRLDLLKEQGAVNMIGKTKSTRYIAAVNEYRPRPKISEAPTVSITLSGPANLALQALSQPIALRNPVNVNVYFLESYRPNIDNYFTDAERKQLLSIGKTKFTGYGAGVYAKGVMHALATDLAYNSCRLEGNAYTHQDAEQLFVKGEFNGYASDMEHQMILNHKDAIDFLVNNAQDANFDTYTLLNLHALLSNNMLLDASHAGQLRSLPVSLDNTTYIPTANVRQIQDRFNLMLEKASQITDPFEQSFFIMVQLPYLVPFADMNLSVARLAANIPMLKKNLMPMSFHGMPMEIFQQALLSVYEQNRVDVMKDLFMFAYQQSCERYTHVKHRNGEPDPFRIQYREQIRTVLFDIVTGNVLPDAAAVTIEQHASAMPACDQLRFLELVEKELEALHEGNIARYWIRPAEFMVWKASWESGRSTGIIGSRVVGMEQLITPAN